VFEASDHILKLVFPGPGLLTPLCIKGFHTPAVMLFVPAAIALVYGGTSVLIKVCGGCGRYSPSVAYVWLDQAPLALHRRMGGSSSEIQIVPCLLPLLCRFEGKFPCQNGGVAAQSKCG
jgi:hypothetical protein